ncbi:DUF6042 family protein [Umezawaea sp.]|uniref:DUF6042 family protein n=1 Tax=Umezawaea sp. TaxID=1955258 RepID=UPI002ECFFB1A
MAVLGFYQDDEHWPEFGTLTIHDTDNGDEDAGPFEQWGLGGQPCGTVARAGYGWLEGSAGDGPLVVRLEVHDSAPPAESDDWSEVVETPYRSRSGAVYLTYVTGSPPEDHLRLGGVGDYRVRVATKALPASAEGPEALWVLRFWPDATPTPPRWLRRSEPAVRSGGAGWEVLRNSPAAELLAVVSMARDETGRTSLDALARWGEPRFGGPGWLAEPLPHKPDSDLDPAALARRLGLPEPRSAHEVLDVFVAAGVLDEDDGGYRTHLPAPRAEDVLDLPAARRAALRQQDEHNRFASFASDLITVALWGGGEQTAAALAERTLVSEGEVREALDWACRAGLLVVEGEFRMALPG